MLVTLLGNLNKDTFECGETRIRYVPWKGFKYEQGKVYALFEKIGNAYILIATVKAI